MTEKIFIFREYEWEKDFSFFLKKTFFYKYNFLGRTARITVFYCIFGDIPNILGIQLEGIYRNAASFGFISISDYIWTKMLEIMELRKFFSGGFLCLICRGYSCHQFWVFLKTRLRKYFIILRTNLLLKKPKSTLNCWRAREMIKDIRQPKSRKFSLPKFQSNTPNYIALSLKVGRKKNEKKVFVLLLNS